MSSVHCKATGYSYFIRRKICSKLTLNPILEPYCMYEVPDHKVGIYCNVIGPLAELRHSAFSCKNVLRYFGKVRHQSNVRIIKYDWLIVLYIFIPFVRIASF